jgi:hypothetical protein
MSPDVGPAAVYLLCLLTSVSCAVLLVRSYIRTRTALLLWTAICFSLLALNNLLLVVDLVLFPTSVDLQLVRNLTALGAVSVLLYGFIRETGR